MSDPAVEPDKTSGEGQFQPHTPPAETIGVRELLSVLRRYLKTIALLLLIGVLCSAFYAQRLPNIYTTRAKLVLEPRDRGLFEAVPEIRKQDLNREAIETELELIKSRFLAERVVDRLGLVQDGYFNPYLIAPPKSDESPAPSGDSILSSARELFSETKEWIATQVAEIFPKKEKVVVPLNEQRAVVVSRFLSKVQVDRFGHSLAILIQASHSDPEKAANIANAVVADYLELAVEQHRTTTDKAINFLSKRAEILAADVSEVEQRIANHRVEYRLDDPQYAPSLRAEIEQLRVRVRLASGDATSLARIEVNLDEKIRLLEQRNLAEIELRQMEREAVSGQERYKQVIARLGNLDLQAEPLNSPGRVLSYAQVPRKASSPKRILIVISGLIAAGVVSLIYILLREGSSNLIRSEVELEKLTGIPSCGMIPEVSQRWWRSRTLPHEYLRSKPFSHYAESIRQLLTSCKAMTDRSSLKTILITSCSQDEAKTTTAVSLAVVAAESNHRTVLLDLDFRKCGASQSIARDSEMQSLDVLLRGECELTEATYQHPEIPLLDVVGFNRYPTQSTNLVNSGVIETILQSLKQNYDIVIIDTPPVFVDGNAAAVAPFADLSLIMLRWNHTSKAGIRGAVRRLTRAAATPVAFAISRVDFAVLARSGYDPSTKYEAYADLYYRN